MNSQLSRELSTIAERMRGARIRREHDIDAESEAYWLDLDREGQIPLTPDQYLDISGMIGIIHALR
ncbi:hypothetical protein [Skermanella stibiiresistens]|uniref:hypothetical protein n=1 Tax=Skermanella stibiiresistens TaxID=913326 RepID=UPI0012FB77FB|nr:hypothetical protein [Skermanella stibiiresistens]